MSSTSADGDEGQTRDCPDCGSEMEYDVIKEAGNEQQTTLYEGWWCSSCRCGMVACEHCDGLHHPDFICEPERKARLEAAKEKYGSTAKVPGHGLVPLEECETIGKGTPVYIIDDGCPEDDCDGDLVFEMVKTSDFAKGRRPEAEYQPICDYCSKFDDGECSHRRP
ncbi:hypothetical protein MUK72_15105 (plasmid) [Halococcus dombrowskii]|uniref:Small CPxCG-related zinc finger protein n=1 Tax=Halococcus dombrowskii TaxID=179637 RepID=A0AAV3SAY9_HALDO|nr:hypothetical protein [Halococcus dombrowskii]UOO96847.1 hypothetical protein MUK72_15105 [Halococcus dombrowskii]